VAIIIDRKKVLEFTYRDIHVIIVEATEGAKCCGEDRSPHLNFCPACGEPLVHEQVSLAFTNDQVLLRMERLTPLAARRAAERFIDQVFARADRLGPAEDQPQDSDDQSGNGKKNGTGRKGPPRPPPKRRPKRPQPPPDNPFDDDDDDGGRGGRRQDEDEITYPPLPSGMNLPGIDSPVGSADRLKEIFEQMAALGWGAKGVELLLEEKRRQDDRKQKRLPPRRT
jgi:hypothetical protein